MKKAIYYPKKYKVIDRKKITKDLKREGFSPLLITEPKGHVYTAHSHPETKILVFLKGGMEITAGGKKYTCRKGDKLVIPGNVVHEATMFDEGCIYFWSERIIEND